MEKQFVTFQIAKELKALGFDEPCLYTVNQEKINDIHRDIYNGHQMEWIAWNSFIPSTNPSLGNCYIAAPLWQQAIDWLYRERQLYISIPDPNWIEDKLIFVYRIFHMDKPFHDKLSNFRFFKSSYFRNSSDSYEEAREKVILKAIELCQK